jgi:acetyl esterase/lipase
MRSTTIGVLGMAVLLAGSVAGCSSSNSTSAASSTAVKLTACPQSATSGFPAGGGSGAPTGTPSGGYPGGGSGSGMAIAKMVKQIDNGGSTVINPSGPAIQCGNIQLTSYNNVVYDSPKASGGKAVQLVADIQVPKTGGNHPLVIYIPGGGFFQADPTQNLNQRTYIADQDYVVASISYRTTTDGTNYVQGVQDVKSAIRYLRAHAAAYHINPNEVAVWGQSAGGYLAAMVGVTGGVSEFEDSGNPGKSDEVQAVVDEFGPSDMSKIADDFDTADQVAYASASSNISQWVFGPGTGKTLASDPEAGVAADPLTYVKASDPPFILMQGTKDTLVSPSQTLILFDALRAKGASATRIALVGAGHGDLSIPGASVSSAAPWSTQKTMGYVTRFLGAHLGG